MRIQKQHDEVVAAAQVGLQRSGEEARQAKAEGRERSAKLDHLFSEQMQQLKAKHATKRGQLNAQKEEIERQLDDEEADFRLAKATRL